jgi:N-acetylneuraminic acid mutarotase
MRRYISGAMLIAGLLLLAVPMFGGDKLTFKERVRAQEAIERVYYNHRIWPKENPGPKPAFEQMVPRAQIEAKVTGYLKKSAALDELWHKPVTGEQLQEEVARITKTSLQPAVLQEIFDALDNDPYLIAECLARPAVAESLARSYYEAVEYTSQGFEDWWNETEKNLGTAIPEPQSSYSLPRIESASCQHGGAGTWYPTGTGTPLAEAREQHKAVWTGAEMIVWAGLGEWGDLVTGGRFYPATNTWLLTSLTNVPDNRHDHTAIWTGSEMIVWGGRYGMTNCNTGGRYNPVTDTWTATSTTNAPSGRYSHTAVWTGTRMVVWGGSGAGYYNDGAKYNPGDDTWIAVATTGAPSVRSLHTSVWTGTEMIVWGGWNGSTTNTGGRYEPVSDTWTTTSTTGAPAARCYHTAVWTDTEMIVWGNGNTGGRYNPDTDSWTATTTTGAPTARASHTAVWTGSEMIVWGGYGGGYLGSGARYNPASNMWFTTSTSGAPSARSGHSAIWTGSGTEMIVWGGYNGSYLNTGGRYCACCSTPVFAGVGSVVDADGCSTGTGITISWSAPSSWGTGATTGTYSVIRYINAGCTFTGTTIVSGLPAATLSYIDMTEIPGTTYYYQVEAMNDCYLSSRGPNPCSAGIKDIAGSVPSGLSQISAADNDPCGDTGVGVSWPQDPVSWGDGGTGARTYDVLRDGSEITSGIPYGTTSYTDTTGANDTLYSYMVRYNNGCSLSAVTNDAGSWASATGFPTGRSEHSSVAYNGYLYVIGGWKGGTDFLDQIEFAHLNSDGTVGAWNVGTHLPTARYEHTSVAYNGYLYVIGGYGSGGFLNEVLYAHINSDGTLGSWSSTTTLPTGRRNHTSVVYNGNLYVIGGFSSSSSRLDQVLYAAINPDGTVGSWTAANALPTPRESHTSVTFNGRLYTIGGVDSGGFLDDVIYADMNGDGTIGSWTATTSLPTALYEHASVSYKGYLYATGGYDGGTYHDSVQLAHINSDGTVGSWGATTVLPGANYQHACAVYNGYMYVIGGGYLNTVWFARINGKAADAADEISPPTGPPSITAADLGVCADTGVLVTWAQDPADWGDGGSGTRTYAVLRNGTPVASGIAYGTITYTDTSGANNTTYTYAVRYVNGCSVPADTAGSSGTDWTGTAPSGLPAVTPSDIDACAPTGIEVSWAQDPGDWGDNGSGTRTYDVLRDGNPIAGGIAYGTMTYTDTSIAAAISYSYSVRYNNGCFLSAATAGAAATDNGSPPSGAPQVTAADTNGCADSDVLVTWAQDPAAWGDGGSGTRTYDVLRDGTPIATGITYGTTSFSDTTGVLGTGYYYSVRYVNGCSLTNDLGSWADTTSFSTRRNGHATVAYNGYLYIIGGSDSDGLYLNDVQYAPINPDGTTGAFTATTGFTSGRYEHTSVAYNGYLYVIGGWCESGWVNDVQFAPINSDGTIGTWTPTTNFATTRTSHTSAVYNGYLYVIGGWGDTGRLSDVQFAPINTDGTIGSWTATASFPTARYEHTSLTHNGYLYVIGGDGGGYLNDVWFAPINGNGTVGTWTTTAGFNTGRYGHKSVVYNNSLYVIGGSGSGGYLGDVQLAPINSNGTVGPWRTTTRLPSNHYGHASEAYGDYLYVTGGYNSSTGYMNDVHYSSINGNKAYAADLAGANPSGLPTVTTEDLNGCTDSGVRVTWAMDPADWGDGGTGARTYDVLRDGAPIAAGLAYGTTHFDDSEGNPTTTYLYSVQYNNGCSLSGLTEGMAGADIIGAAPTGLPAITATDQGTCDKGILITWPQDPSSWRDNDSGTRTYDVLRDGAAIATGIPYGTTSFTDNTGTAGATYTYKVRYVNGCSLSAATHAVGSWTSTASFTTGRYGHTSVTYNGYVYVMGGYLGGTSYLNDVQFASMNTNGTVNPWTAAASFPTQRSYHTSVVYNGYVYIIGGYNGSYLNDVQYAPLNPDGTVGTWASAGAGFPSPRYSHASVVYNGYLYVIGGYAGGTSYLNDVRFAHINPDGSLGAWTAAASFPTARYRHTAVAYNGYLYVIGGRSSTANLDDIQVAPINGDGTIGAFVATTNLTIWRWGHTSVAFDGYMYLLGSYSSRNSVQFAAINTDGTLGSWADAPGFINGRSQHTSVIRDGYLYVIGGYNGSLLNNVQYARINASSTVTEADGTPSTPDITSIVDNDPNLMSGITIYFTAGSPATQHDLYRDGALAQAGFSSGSTHTPGDTSPHNYKVKAVNGACSAESSAVQGTDAESIIVPPEIAVGTSYPGDAISWSGTVTAAWPSTGTATGYRFYRGDRSNLLNLLGDGTDFCTHYDGTDLNHDCSSDDPSLVTGRCYYYLVTAYNGGGEGSAGNATQGERRVNSSGGCP